MFWVVSSPEGYVNSLVDTFTLICGHNDAFLNTRDRDVFAWRLYTVIILWSILLFIAHYF